MNDADIQKTFVNESCAIMLKLDPEGIITYLNKIGCDFFGFTKEEVEGKPILDTIAPRKESSGRDLEDMFRRFNEFPHEFLTNFNENIKKDGTRVWFAWANRAEFDDEGWIKGFVCVGIDVTNAQNDSLVLRKENRFLKSTLNAFDDAFFVTDKEGKPKGYSRSFKQLFPDTLIAFKKRNVMQLIEIIASSVREDDREIFRQAAGNALSSSESMQGDDDVHGYITRQSEAGLEDTIFWQARPRLSDGEFMGLLWLFHKESTPVENPG
jgi:PAS domain S-box-containing protein